MTVQQAITVFEGRYTQLSLNGEQRKELLALEPLFGRQHLVLRADDRLLVHRYVGFVSTPSLQLQILPKLFDDADLSAGGDEERHEAVAMLFRLLATSGYMKVKDVPDAQGIAEWDGDLLEIFIHVFVKRFLHLYGRQVHRQYEDREDNVALIKGKILFHRQVLHNGELRHRHYVQVQEFTENTLLNQILKTTLLSLLAATKRRDNKWELAKALLHLEEVQTVRLTREIWQRVRFNRLNEAYRPLFEMAKLFYLNRQPGMYAGDERMFTFLVPLNGLFEYSVYRWLEEGLAGRGLDVRYQKPQRYLDAEEQSFLLKPDITVWGAADRGSPVHIVDAKYKNPLPDGKVRLSEADLYQLIAYAVRYRCDRLLLVYPVFRSNRGRVNPLAVYRVPAGPGAGAGAGAGVGAGSEEREIVIAAVQVDVMTDDLAAARDELVRAVAGVYA